MILVLLCLEYGRTNGGCQWERFPGSPERRPTLKTPTDLGAVVGRCQYVSKLDCSKRPSLPLPRSTEPRPTPKPQLHSV